jgi:CRP-like cAMP-binding protein
MREIHYNPDDIVFSQGDGADGVYFVRCGSFAIRHRPDGLAMESEIGDLRAGDLFGEVAIIDGAPRGWTVVAKSAAVCDFVEAAEFRKAFAIDNGVALPLLRMLTARLRGVLARVDELERDIAELRPGGTGATAPAGAAPRVRITLRPGNGFTATMMRAPIARIERTPFQIGRSVSQGLSLDPVNNVSIAPIHCEIDLIDGRPIVRDLGAPGHTMVNSEVAAAGLRSEVPLQIGYNVLTLGSAESLARFRVEILDAQAE